MPARLPQILALVGVSLPLAGCCTFARLFCGPDDSLWVSEQYETPAQTLATFQEALRRADRTTLRRCLSESYRERHGLDTITIELAWSKLRDTIPGIHLLGTAAVAGPEIAVDGRRIYVLSVAGEDVRISLSRCPYWELRWGDPIGAEEPLAEGEYVPALSSFGVVGEGGEPGTTAIAIRLPDVPARIGSDEIIFAGVGVLWKVDDIEPVVEPSTASAGTK